jgi:hypothetical protein
MVQTYLSFNFLPRTPRNVGLSIDVNKRKHRKNWFGMRVLLQILVVTLRDKFKQLRSPFISRGNGKRLNVLSHGRTIARSIALALSQALYSSIAPDK